MLIYSEQRLVPTDVNMMVLAGMGGYFYIHRALYDQAVVLDDIYCDDHELLIKAVTNREETRPDVEKFFEEVPRPINIFAPYLLLVKEEITDIIDMIGAIHAMSGPINLRRMLKVPFEMRNNPSFSLSIRDEYQLAWDRFFLNTTSYEDMMNGAVAVASNARVPMNGTNTTTEPVEGELSNVGDDGVEYADPLEALLYGCSDDIFDLDEEDEEEESESVETPVPVPEPEPAPTTVVEEVPVNKNKSGLELLSEGLV